MTASSSNLGGFLGPNLDPNTPLYRIYPQKFLEGLLSGRFVVRSTRTWKDPYEHLVSRCSYSTIENGRITPYSLENNWLPTFGQCWSTCCDSDALWRIYSIVQQNGLALEAAFDPDEAVRLRTTAQKLLNALATGMGTDKSRGCFIARLKYFKEEALTQEIANIIGTSREAAFRGAAGQADALLFKRDAFTHENEVRLIYVDGAREFEKKEQIEITISPNDVIEEITFDPRVNSGNQEAWRTAWVRERGFKNEVNRSLLYLGALLVVPLYTQEDLAKISPDG